MSLRKEGDVILSSEPFVHVLSQSERGKRCEQCFKSPKTLLRCSACTVLRYCDRTCQRRNWRFHKLECQALKQVSPQVPTASVRLMFKLLLRLKWDEETLVNDGDPGWRNFSQFMSHCDSIKKDPVRQEQFIQLSQTLQLYAGKLLDLPSSTQLLELFGKMSINSFSICDGEMQPIGTGVYLSPSSLDHSCSPNAVAVFDGTRLEVRAVRQHKDTDQVFISYIDQLAPSGERKRQLREQYYFECSCSSCEDEALDSMMMSTVCTESSCKGPVTYDTKLQCELCGLTEFSDTYTIEKDNALLKAKFQLEKLDQARKEQEFDRVLELCKEFLSKNSILHTINVYVVRINDRAFDACIEMGLFEKALEFGQCTVEAYKTYYPQFHPNLGVQSMKIGKIQLFLEQYEVAFQSLQKAEKALKISHGTSHPIYRDLVDLLEQCSRELQLTGQ